VSLPLTNGVVDGSQSGFGVGYRNRNWVWDLQYAVAGESSIVGLLGGYHFGLYSGNGLTFGVVPKLGLFGGTIALGEAAVITGKTPPVILSEGTINEGEAVTAAFSGLGGQLALMGHYSFTEALGLEFQLGYTHAVLGEMKINAGDVEIAKDSRALVKNDLSTTQAGIDPVAKSSGVYTNVNLSWAF